MGDLATKKILQTCLWTNLYSLVPWALLASCMLHPSLRNGNKIRHAERYPAPNPGLSGSYPAQCLCQRVWVNYAWHWKNDHPNPMSLKGPWLKGFWLGSTSPQCGVQIKDGDTTISRCLLAGAASASAAAAWASSAALQIRSIHII